MDGNILEKKRTLECFDNNAETPNTEPYHKNDEAEPGKIRTDADIVKELVEMKHLPKKKKIRTPAQRLFSRKYHVLIEEVSILQSVCKLL